MNTFLKYAPYKYFITCRVKPKNLPAYIYWHIVFVLIPIIYAYYIQHISFSQFISGLGIFSILFLLHHALYEIGYLYNDHYSIKNEKNPTIRIRDTVSDSFILYQMALRGIVVFLGGVLIFFFLKSYFIYYLLLVGSTIIAYIAHNVWRNRLLNYFSRLALRIIKLSIIFPVLYLQINTEISQYLTPLLLFFSLRELYDIIMNAYKYFLKQKNIDIKSIDIERQNGLLQGVYILYMIVIGIFHGFILWNKLYFFFIGYYGIFFLINWKNGLYQLSKYKR